MSDPNLYEDDDDQGKPDPVRAQLKRVEAENKSLKAKADAADKAIRRLAFVDAGIDTSTLTAQDFVKAYEGELTPEAIREAATARKLIEPKADPALDAEAETAQRIASARVAGESTSVTQGEIAQIDAIKTPQEAEAFLAKQLAGFIQ